MAIPTSFTQSCSLTRSGEPMPDALHAKNDESVHTMTLRLPDGLYEVIRKRAFDERTTITSQIVVALREQFRTWGLGCDVCGKAHVEVSTPGGFRFCAEHGTKPHG